MPFYLLSELTRAIDGGLIFLLLKEPQMRWTFDSWFVLDVQSAEGARGPRLAGVPVWVRHHARQVSVLVLYATCDGMKNLNNQVPIESSN